MYAFTGLVEEKQILLWPFDWSARVLILIQKQEKEGIEPSKILQSPSSAQKVNQKFKIRIEGSNFLSL
jgi:hypothetical protein